MYPTHTRTHTLAIATIWFQFDGNFVRVKSIILTFESKLKNVNKTNAECESQTKLKRNRHEDRTKESEKEEWEYESRKIKQVATYEPM